MRKSFHGASAYAHNKCRCDICTEANTKRCAATKARLRGLVAAGLRNIPHGTKSGYVTYGCREDCCRAAMRSLWAKSR